MSPPIINERTAETLSPPIRIIQLYKQLCKLLNLRVKDSYMMIK
jgi:hypothetical protein